MNSQLVQKNNEIVTGIIILTTIKNKNIVNELSLTQYSNKNITSAISSRAEHNFQNLLNNQIKSKPSNDQSTSANVDSSNQTKKISKEAERSASADKKQHSYKHEKIEKNSYNPVIGESLAQTTPITSNISQDLGQNLSPSTNDSTTHQEAGVFTTESPQSAELTAAVANKNITLLNGLTSFTSNVGLPLALTKNLGDTLNEGLASTNEIQATIQATSISSIATTPTPTTSSAVSTNANNLNLANWQYEVNQKITWMNNGDNQSATLMLNSQELGPLKVVIHINNAQADANFTSNNPQLRQVLEDGMSNLREMMKQSGIELGQANINSGNERNGEKLNQFIQYQSSNRLNPSNSDNSIDQSNSLTPSIKKLDSLVNTFA